ncbi:glutamate--cysteine ligase [Shewanella surugensis]|uniref:Glutamate--cysteine ligase n=1 Tax=Shewanella surugensis TaxID=212020 RepID=A0ABT0LHJ7_9GAMM|nr:glutamate--cysteine ligase [Shewanella surugensis]MCL1127178.1 glutamate--cysteine ligase [Shewanella surugensis]
MKSFNKLVEALSDQPGRKALRTMYRGIEREALRIEKSGHLAMDAHPKVLGSALMHSRITTDYSESLLEFITPVHSDINALLNDLKQTHAYTVQNIKGQQLWPVSMPCYVGDTTKIPIADYGTSNVGKMKRLYRKGLTHRYGALMQIISGVHFNFSASKPLFEKLHVLSGKQNSLTDFTSDAYFGLIRNYRRLVWVLPYLFGASPAICQSFLKNQSTDLNFKMLGQGTLYLPYATSLRMSDLGYTNQEQERLNISYNSLPQYLEGMKAAINMPSANFEKMGVKVNDDYRQLNANVLQIENEFYAPIRAKRVTLPGEKPSEALARSGVEYIEVRALDVNPFSEVGISDAQVRFLDLFLLYCLLEDSPCTDLNEEQTIATNLKSVVLEGRKPNLTLLKGGESIALSQWMNELFVELNVLAELIDEEGDMTYQRALSQWSQAISDPNKTLSGQIMQELGKTGMEHGHWVAQLAKNYQAKLWQYPLSAEIQKQYQTAADDSLTQQVQLEASDKLEFDEYLRTYFKNDYED